MHIFKSLQHGGSYFPAAPKGINSFSTFLRFPELAVRSQTYPRSLGKGITSEHWQKVNIDPEKLGTTRLSLLPGPTWERIR
jgi:hypothetical protein